MITFYKLSNGNVRLTINGEVYLLNPSLSVIPLQSENDRIIITNNLTYPIKNGLDILISSISYPTFTDRNDLINILGTYYFDGKASHEVDSILRKQNNLQANQTVSGITLATNTGITSVLVSNSPVTVYLNGQQINVGNTSQDWCFFSSDNGITKKQSGQETQNDMLYWDSNIAPFNLEIDDIFDFLYLEKI